MAAQRLIERGHRHLAFFNPAPDQSYYLERSIAFQAVAQQAINDGCAESVAIMSAKPLLSSGTFTGGAFGATGGGTLSASAVLSQPSAQSSFAAMEAAAEQFVSQWLAASPRPTGVFVPVDRVTLRVYRHLQQHGVQPGRDVTIISCDNEAEMLSLMDPVPESIDLNRKAVARLAVERLLWRMKNGPAAPSIVITVSPALAGRGNGIAQPPVPMSGVVEATAAVPVNPNMPSSPLTPGRRDGGRVHPASSIGL